MLSLKIAEFSEKSMNPVRSLFLNFLRDKFKRVLSAKNLALLGNRLITG